MYGYYSGKYRRICFFHKWQRYKVVKERFVTIWCCNRCGEQRERQLKAADESAIETQIALVRNQDRRKELWREFRYEMSKGNAADELRIQQILAELNNKAL